MKYCVHCGAEMYDEAVVCVKCGRSVAGHALAQTTNSKDNTMSTVIKIFLILSCVASAFAVIPLAWMIPMTISIFRSLRDNRPISMGMKICTLLFVNLIAGICLLCMNEDR